MTTTAAQNASPSGPNSKRKRPWTFECCGSFRLPAVAD